ncbi:siroheme decarboxylase subunit beta [Moritella viscosa]|uniref:siroheme decarboxylase n=1 Tax=Moritella viscosa TaxID=80854 RepID=A0A1L0BWV0_9GAMM|nr:Lrp/AsnC family transcriptional regulator [Moritella viscosa]SGZ10448.1 Putative heme biosythesis protein [Moritella viscosa]SGZ15410.1 Putative heme biosythesis protein [Moritella viscosa]SHO14854.1 Putative heme biosythesis protein [Moritella viscosa]SHO15026.1 Putative heme biosythesis protein [Moritella viscosa]SHO17556.1 Putative heme biosythesis protein [Moritella viscosa]
MSVSTLKSETKSLTQPMTELQRQYILLTQNGLPIVAKPFNWLAEQLGISLNDVLTMTKDMQNKGIIRRIAAVPNHYKLGYTHNGMTVWDVVDSDASRLGKLIGELPFVSHCYLRPRHLPHWNYNIFAMVHGKTQGDIDKFKAQIHEILINSLRDHDMLTSTRILKKTGLRLKHKGV